MMSHDGGNVAYDDDLHGWAIEQAAHLRTGRIDLIDWKNLAEELEGMARSEYRALESALRVLLLHLLKWDAQPAFRSKSWLLSVEEQHSRYERLLEDSPSLKQHLEQIRADAHKSARRLAAAETGLDIVFFPIDPPGWNVINNPPAREEDLPQR
jgi:hypothetical protein